MLMTNLSQDEIELILLYRRLTEFEKECIKRNIKRFMAFSMKIPLMNIQIDADRLFIKFQEGFYMNNLITLKIKATSFDRLIDELKSLKDMYLDFSNNTDNIIAGSSFHIVAKDLETLIAKYEYKKSPLH